MKHRDMFLRKLHHRVKNNFQIIASLMSLQRRLLPPDRREDLRFVEEHVQAMSVAYRLVDTSGELVPLDGLVAEVAETMRVIARVPPEGVAVTPAGLPDQLGLDRAIALSLYLAAVLAPCMDHALTADEVVRVACTAGEGEYHLTVSCGAAPRDFTIASTSDFLRDRLTGAYMRQLDATPTPNGIRFPLGAVAGAEEEEGQ